MYPKEIRDILIKGGKFINPIDFIVLDYDTDDRVSILLGHPLLEMGEALIDVRKSTIKIRLDDEEVVLKVYKPLNPPSYYKDMYDYDHRSG